MQPQEVATCLVHELWQTLRASLEAHAGAPPSSTHSSSPLLMSP